MAVALGGGLGSLLRWALSGATPAGPLTGIPWPTWGINIAGCLAIGILLVLLTEAVAAPHPLVRPFLGTGLLGGFTTMSTYADQVLALSRAGEAVLAVGYLCGTLTAALAAVAVGVLATRALTGVRPLLGARP
ncbi:MAG: CrcB family protein [Austwickia sp.]|nr:CrcB family protein [Austwickia sp.]MBK8436270.1 CrcB family protein [Austwickia sp.]MBK9101947.1 CrcB family protein [Austwickia sp.]